MAAVVGGAATRNPNYHRICDGRTSRRADGCIGTVAFRPGERVNCPGCKVMVQAPRAAFALRCGNCTTEMRPATLVTPKGLEQAAEEQSGLVMPMTMMARRR